MNIKIKPFAFFSGVVMASTVLLYSWWRIFQNGSTKEQNFMSKVYRGYTISIPGSFIGAIWAFVDGIVGGAIIGWVWNAFSRKSDTIDE